MACQVLDQLLLCVMCSPPFSSLFLLSNFRFGTLTGNPEERRLSALYLLIPKFGQRRSTLDQGAYHICT